MNKDTIRRNKKRINKHDKLYLYAAYQDALERGDSLAADKLLATMQNFDISD